MCWSNGAGFTIALRYGLLKYAGSRFVAQPNEAWQNKVLKQGAELAGAPTTHRCAAELDALAEEFKGSSTRSTALRQGAFRIRLDRPSPTACLAHLCRHAGTHDDCLEESFQTVRSTYPKQVCMHIYTQIYIIIRTYRRAKEVGGSSAWGTALSTRHTAAVLQAVSMYTMSILLF